MSDRIANINKIIFAFLLFNDILNLVKKYYKKCVLFVYGGKDDKSFNI